MSDLVRTQIVGFLMRWPMYCYSILVNIILLIIGLYQLTHNCTIKTLTCTLIQEKREKTSTKNRHGTIRVHILNRRKAISQKVTTQLQVKCTCICGECCWPAPLAVIYYYFTTMKIIQYWSILSWSLSGYTTSSSLIIAYITPI